MHNIRLIFVLFLILPISLLAQIPLNGFVLDEDDQPYIGLELEIFETGQKTNTNNEGYYSFDMAEDGVYALVVRHPYHDIYKAVTVEDTTEYDVVIRREIKFDEVIIKATRASENDPIAYSEVKGETLALQSYGQDVPYLLQFEPSMVVTSDAGAGIGYTGMRIRGTDATRIAVTINGIPLNDSESQSVYWVDLPDFASSTDDVQIQRGVGSSTNGSGSFGGSMNFNTNKLHLDSYTKLNGSVGAFGTRKAGISIGTGLIEGHYGIDARYSTIHSDGYIDRASSGLQSLYLSGVYVGQDKSIRFTIFNGHEITYQAWNGLPYQYLAIDSLRTYNSAGQDQPNKPYKDEVDNYSQTHYQLFYNKEYNKQWDLAIAPFYTHGKGYYEQYKSDQTLSDYKLVNIDTSINDNSDLIRRKWLDNHFYGASYSLNYSSEDEKSDFTIGGLLSQYLGAHYGEVIGIPFPEDSLFTTGLPQNYYDNNAVKNDANIFAKYAFRPNGNWQFLGDVQYRFVDYKFKGFDDKNQYVDRKETLHFINPKLGISYIKNKHLFYISMAHVGHEPNRRDYTEAPANQVPKPEFLLDGELGYKWTMNKSGFFVNLYHMMYKDQLVLSGKINDVGDPVRINIPESFRRGVELGTTTSFSDFTFMGNLTISQNKAVEFTEYIDNWDTGIQEQRIHQNTDLSFSPSIIAGVGLDYNLNFKTAIPQHLNISYRMKYVGAQFLDNTSSETTKLDAYNYSNLQLAYNISYKRMKDATLKLQINNLFNQNHVSNGWAYRFNYTDKTVLDWDPSSVAENGREGTYNLIGLYPQAGAHIILGLDVSF